MQVHILVEKTAEGNRRIHNVYSMIATALEDAELYNELNNGSHYYLITREVL